MIYISVLMSVRPGGGDESLHQQPLQSSPSSYRAEVPARHVQDMDLIL